MDILLVKYWLASMKKLTEAHEVDGNRDIVRWNLDVIDILDKLVDKYYKEGDD